MRICKVTMENVKYKDNLRIEKVAGETFKEVIRKAEKLLYSNERIQSAELIASTDV